MDSPTLAAYDRAAAAFAADWHEQPEPADLHALVMRFFKPGPTADIGCGSGREVAWLCAHGFPCVGYDPSDGLLAQARARYPDLDFRSAALPDLDDIAEGAYDNVLCETVIMHLAREAIAPSVRRLVSILKPAGTLYLSWRVGERGDQRDKQGRLYAAFDKNLVLAALTEVKVLFDHESISTSSEKKVHRVIARREVA